MNWPLKRKSILATTFIKPTLQSNLKQKLCYIARLKCLSNGIAHDIQSEDLSRFIHEIVQTILSVPLQKKETIQSIIESCHYFNVTYVDFGKEFLASLKNVIRENSKELSFLYVYFYYEVMRIGICSFEIKSIAKMFEVMKNDQRYKLCELLSSVYEEEHTFGSKETEYSAADLKIAAQTKNAILNFLKRIENLSLEQVSIVMINLKEEKLFEKEYIKKNFQQVIDIAPNEFKFYEPCDSTVETEIDLEYFLTHLIWYINSPSDIDSIAKRQLNSFKKDFKEYELNLSSDSKSPKTHNGNVITAIMKFANTYDTIPVLARFISFFNIKTLVTYLENDSKDQSLIFLCELSKFNVYSKFKILMKLEEMIRKKNINSMIMILDCIGRFYLHHKETNLGMRNIFEKIKILRNENSGSNRIDINSAVGRIMNKSQKNETLDDFFSFMIAPEKFKNSELNAVLSDEHLLLLFLKPWIFTDLSFIYTISVERNIDALLSKLLYESILLCALSGKLQQSISYTTLYSYFPQELKKFVDKIMSLKIRKCEKAYILMIFLDRKEEKVEFIDEIKMLVELSESKDVKNHFMHWVAQHGINSHLLNLDNEIELLRLY